jgi:hypothetical protein
MPDLEAPQVANQVTGSDLQVAILEHYSTPLRSGDEFADKA